MKALEFVTVLEDEKHIDIPTNLQADIHKNQSVRVLILVDEDQTDEKGWAALTQKHFLNGYSDADAIYDKD